MPSPFIPEVSVHQLVLGATGRAQKDELSEALRSHGNVLLVEHGVDPAVIARAFAVTRQFFDLPIDEKLEFAEGREQRVRGYRAVPRDGDFRESWFTTHGIDAPPGSSLVGCNVWPSRPARLEAAATALAEQLRTLGGRMVELFERDLALPRGTWTDAFGARPPGGLRLLRYPPPPPGRVGTAPHEDLPAFALLCVDDCGGLEVHVGDGRWVEVPAREGAVVLQLGLLMERWSNGLYRASRHRVLNRSGRNRHSMIFFGQPPLECVVQAPPGCCSEERPAKYAPASFGEIMDGWMRQMRTELE